MSPSGPFSGEVFRRLLLSGKQEPLLEPWELKQLLEGADQQLVEDLAELALNRYRRLDIRGSKADLQREVEERILRAAGQSE